MRASIVFVLMVSILTPVVAEVQPIADDDASVAGLGGAEASERLAASDKLVSTGAAAVVPLVKLMDKHGEQTAGKMAYQTLFRVCQQKAGTDRADEISRELGRELLARHPEKRFQLLHEVETCRRICRLLSFVGNDPAVDDLYRSMNRPELAEMARWALECIPTRRATEALVGATQITAGKTKLGVLEALGRRRDLNAAPMLAALTRSESEAERMAAVHSLAMIPEPQAIDLIAEAVKASQPGAVDALLTYGETLLDDGMAQNAAQGLRTVGQLSSLSAAQRSRLLHGWARVGGKEALELVVNSVDAAEAHVRGAAVQACAMIEGQDATTAIAKKMAAATGALKADLIDALGQRARWMNEESAELIAQAVSDADEAVRVAAIVAIEDAAITSATPAVLRALHGPAGPVRDAAEHAINHTPGDDVTQQLVQAIPNAAPAVRAMLVLALGSRGDARVLGTLSKADDDEDVNVRVAAFKAIGRLQAEAAFDTLLAAFKRAPGPDRDAAERAMRKLGGDKTVARMLEAYAQAGASEKPSLLRVIGYRKHADVPPLLSKEVGSEDADIRAAAVEGLSRQDDPNVAPTLLTVAKRGPAKVTEAAMAGYLRAAQRAEGSDQTAAGGMYVEALKLAVTDEQKLQALSGIGRAVDPGQTSVLDLVEPFMENANTRVEAARAVTHFATHLPETQKDRAITLLRRVVQSAPDEGTTRRAVEHLRKLGVKVDPALDAGFITTWWIVGPFANPNDEMFGKAYFPEQKVDLNAEEKVGDQVYRWKKHRTSDLQGLVDLIQVVADRNNIGAYAYAEISVDAARDVLVKTGSDDGIVVWINGQKVHAFQGARGVKVDEDQVPAHLQAGANQVLVKCLNGASAWGFCLRLSMADGQPLKFKQQTE